MNEQPKSPTLEELAKKVEQLSRENTNLQKQVRAVEQTGGFPQAFLDQLENLQYLKPPPIGSPLPEDAKRALTCLRHSLARIDWTNVGQLPVQLQDLGFIHQAGKPSSGGCYDGDSGGGVVR